MYHQQPVALGKELPEVIAATVTTTTAAAPAPATATASGECPDEEAIDFSE